VLQPIDQKSQRNSTEDSSERRGKSGDVPVLAHAKERIERQCGYQNHTDSRQDDDRASSHRTSLSEAC
jgi:hypothetical protein